MISDELLRAIRNELPMKVTILRLGRQGPPSKHSEGYFRFLCPSCGELRATVNPRINLAHCFACTTCATMWSANMWGTFNEHGHFHSVLRNHCERHTARTT